MRSITKVIERIIAVVPPQESDFIARLNHTRLSCSYTAPEDMQRRWHELASIFNSCIPYPPKEAWHQKAADIFMDTEEAPTDGRRENQRK